MRWISGVLGAVLLAAVAAQPAGAVVVDMLVISTLGNPVPGFTFVSNWPDGPGLAGYEVQVGKGKKPKDWRTVAKKPGRKISSGVVALLKPADFGAPGTWTVRLVVRDRGGRTREARAVITLQ